MSETVQEGLWKCSNCTMKDIPGLAEECPACGDPHNPVLEPGEDWYLPDNAKVITDPYELADANAGPSWTCGHCGRLNKAGRDTCKGCKEPKGFNDVVHREVVYDDKEEHFDPQPVPRDEMIEDKMAEAERTITTGASGPRILRKLIRPRSHLPTSSEDVERASEFGVITEDVFNGRARVNKLPAILKALYADRRKAIIIGATVMAVLLIIGIVVIVKNVIQQYTATVPGTVTVSELHWVRSVEVEEFKTLTESGWAYPGDARVQNSENRIRSYRTVHDRWDVEKYTDYETHYKEEKYDEPRYKDVEYKYDCNPYTVNNGNGTFTTKYRTCTGTKREPDGVTRKTRQVPYSVPVEKERPIEITHQEPVFGTWYTYQVDRWMTDRWAANSDATSAKVIWPEVTDLSRNDQHGDQVGEERVGNERNASYTIVYTDSQGVKHSEKNDDEKVWSKLEPGETVSARYYERNDELSSVDWESVT